MEYFQEFTLSVFTIISGAYVYYRYDKNRIMQNILNEYSSIVILVIIGISVLVMNFISRKFSHTVSIKEKTSLRLLGSIYSVINLIAIQVVIVDIELNSIIVCYVGLLLGRFIFFDSSIKGMFVELKDIGKKYVLAIIMGLYVLILLSVYKKNGIDIIENNIIFSFVTIYCGMIFGLKASRDIINIYIK